jgi:hypothetical protein
MPISRKTITRRAAVWLVVVFSAALLTASAANAQNLNNGDGTWRVANCMGGTSQFVSNAFPTNLGFGGTTTTGAQLVQSGDGSTAGARVNLHYRFDNDGALFLGGGFNFIGGGDGLRKNTTIHFCFQTNGGTGRVLTISKTLNQAVISSAGKGVKFAAFAVNSFDGVKVDSMVLRRVSFTLNGPRQPSNITIGELNVGTNSGQNDPVGIDLTPGFCDTLFTCPATATASN